MAPLAELAPGMIIEDKTASALAGELTRVQSIEKLDI
jgi:hypothetical protein